MQDDILRAAVRESIMLEMSRWKKEGVPREKALDRLSRYTGPNSYIHYSDINKLGVNPQSTFKTPIGIYGYLLDDGYQEKLVMGGGATFARDRKYVHVFSARHPATVLNIAKYDEQRYEEDADILRRRLGDLLHMAVGKVKFDVVKRAAERRARVQSPGGHIWSLTRDLADQDARRWTKILTKHLMYTGVRDEGTGTIHENEPAQAVFFGLDVIRQLVTLDNTIETFSTLKQDQADERFNAAVIRFDRSIKALIKQSQDTPAAIEALRTKMIDPWLRSTSSNVRYMAAENASQQAVRTLLGDSSPNVRRSALHRLRTDKEVLLRMANDPSPKVIDDVIDHIANELTDPVQDRALLDALRKISEDRVDFRKKVDEILRDWQ